MINVSNLHDILNMEYHVASKVCSGKMTTPVLL